MKLLIAIILLLPLSVSAGLSTSVEAWLAEADEDATVVVWVFFQDKGQYSLEETRARIGEAGAAFDPKAISRRLKARPGEPFGASDLPLHRPYVEALEAEGVKFRAFSRWLNATSIEASRHQVERLAGLPFVTHVRRVSGRRGGPEPKISVPEREPMAVLGQYGNSIHQLQQIQVPQLHTEGYTGSGVRIAVFDTGFWLGHESVSGIDLIAQHDFINDDGETANEPGDLESQHRHGTQVLSAVGGNSPGILMGPAYDAEYILAKTEDMSMEEPIEEDWWIEAAEWADSLGAQIITSSLCYNDWYTYEDMDGNTAPITIAADMAVVNGIVVTNAAGNSGASSWRYMLAPADGDSVISVGSVDSTGVRSAWSSQGPTYDGRIKPTIMAMGEDTYIADLTASDTYREGDGTSFATPVAAGAIALVLQKNPVWGPPEVLEAIMTTATQSSTPDSLYGWGILQAYDASDYDAAASAGRALVAGRISIYPNPCRTGFFVQAPSQRSAGIAGVYDVRGRLLGEFEIGSGGITRVDLDALVPGLRPGVIFVRVPDSAGAKVLVIE